MKHTYTPSLHHPVETLCWTPALRLLHWLTALTLVGAASFTEQGDAGHAELGWIAMGLLLMLQMIYSGRGKTNWALWFVTGFTTAVNVSGWLTPDHTSHFLVTFGSVTFAAFYCATVIFELLNLLLTRLFSNGSGS
jgi:hypothetical protein